MSYVGGGALLFALWWVVLNRYGAGCAATGWDEIDNGVTARERGGAQRTVTDLVASAWALTCIYGVLLILTPPIAPAIEAVVIVAVPLLASCAALERFRWSRKALLGISLVALLDASCAVGRMAFAERPSAFAWVQLIEHPVIWKTAFSGFTGSPWFGAGVVALASFTLCWLPRREVRREFEHRKRANTRRHQIAIAGILVAAYWFGVCQRGLSRNVGFVLQERVAAGQRRSTDQTAFRNESTTSRSAQR